MTVVPTQAGTMPTMTKRRKWGVAAIVAAILVFTWSSVEWFGALLIPSFDASGFFLGPLLLVMSILLGAMGARAVQTSKFPDYWHNNKPVNRSR